MYGGVGESVVFWEEFVNLWLQKRLGVLYCLKLRSNIVLLILLIKKIIKRTLV